MYTYMYIYMYVYMFTCIYIFHNKYIDLDVFSEISLPSSLLTQNIFDIL